jgi:hypothetical protein
VLLSVIWVLAGVAATVWVVVTQSRTRAVRDPPPLAGVIARWILLAYGLFLVGLVLGSQARQHPLDVWTVLVLVVMTVSAIGFGIARGYATRIWRDGAAVLRRGGTIVVVLWAVSIAIHVGTDWLLDTASGIGGLGIITTLAFLVVTVTAQNMTIRRRARPLRA